MEKVNQVSIRLVKERPLLSEEQLTSPEKVAMTVGDYIRNIDREVLCVINFNSKLHWSHKLCNCFTKRSTKISNIVKCSKHDDFT